MPDFYQKLKEKAAHLGFTAIGVIPASPARRLYAYLHWIEANMHGTMQYMARTDRVERRKDPRLILPDIKSIVCVVLDYGSIEVPPEIAHDSGRGRISNYAWGEDYHNVMIPQLEELAHYLRRMDPQARCRVYVDTGAILERDHAESAGLGFTGKNTMLIAPRRGSMFFIGELLTTLPLIPDQPLVKMPSCGTCTNCLQACPTQAFPQPYILDARRCISYLTIEFKEWIPKELRAEMANWVYGCDVCQEVCPFNRFVKPMDNPVFTPVNWDKAAPKLIDLLTLGDEEFNHLFAGSPINRIRRPRLLRNACVAAGNWRSETAVNPLAALLKDAEPIVRGHAAWALHQINTQTAQILLTNALESENDPMVRRELAGL